MSKIIEITVEGGVLQHVDNIPEGIEIHVKDFDVQDDTDPDLEFNSSGDPYYLSIYRGEHHLCEHDLP